MSIDMPAPHYPMFLNLSGRSVVIVGDGPSLERKASTFLRYGADVTIISPEATGRLREMAVEGSINLEQREYARGDLEGVALVICTGASEAVSRAVYLDADARGCPVNVGGTPESCNYLIPTSLRRGPLQISISTSGAAPSVAKRLRDEIKASYGEEWGTYVTLLGSIRALAIDRIPEPAERDDVLAEVAAADLLSRIAAGEVLDAESVLAEFAPQATADDTGQSKELEEQA
jgi:precorrin-2 dehydrogenase / sirohydrochlorin ferrochelatase